MDEELRNSLIRLYETLRYQQEMIGHLQMKISALETALTTNQSFAELYAQATTIMKESEIAKQHELALLGLDLVLRELKGEPGIGHA